MVMIKQSICAMVGVLAAACSSSLPWIEPGSPAGGRELRPARAGINVGSLYFARERATDDISKPVNLERLCEVSLDKYSVTPVDAVQADMDLTSQVEGSAAASGIKNIFVNLGLSGNLGDYYEYKLTNVVDRSISYQEAQDVFKARAFKGKCPDWRAEISRNKWARYQILSIKTGDIVFQRKSDIGGSVDLKAKIAVAEPQLKAALSRKYNLAVSGRGVVIAVNPIIRE
jgi:hypothetical protein